MAGRARLIQTSFSGGEISRSGMARVDTELYSQAAARMRNFLVRPNGKIDRRGGSLDLGAARNNSPLKKMFVLRRGVNDIVRIEAGGGKFRFWDGMTRALITSGGSPVEVDIPWADSELRSLRTWQVGDVLWFASVQHDRRVYRLARTALDAFNLAEFEIDEGPFTEARSGQATLTFGAVTGASVAVTASAATFKAEHVGALIRLEAQTAVGSTAADGGYSTWSFDQPHNTGDFCRNGNNIYSCVARGNNEHGRSGDAPPIHTEGREWDGSSRKHLLWQFEGFTYGLVRVVSVASATSATVQVLRRLPFYGAMALATNFWQLQALSDEQGWPGCGAIYEDRLCLFGSRARPDMAFLSRTNQWTPDEGDFRPPFAGEVLDTDAIRKGVSHGNTPHIVWAAVMDGLLLGTSEGVVRLAGPSADEGMTPAGTVPRVVTTIGASPFVPGIVIDYALIYPSYSEDELIEVSRISDSVPRNLLDMAEHLLTFGIKAMAWCGRPSKTLYVVEHFTNQLYALCHAPENGAIAWSKHELGGRLGDWPCEIDDISAAPGPNGRDELWLIVARTVSGATVRRMEYLAETFRPDRMRLDDACVLDHARAFDAWNTDLARSVTLTQVGDEIQLNATGGDVFLPADVGKVFFFSPNGAQVRDLDKPGPIRVEIRTYTNASVARGVLVGAYEASDYAGKTFTRFARAQSGLSGLTHLAGLQVMVNGDGASLGPFTVTAGGGVDFGGALCAKGFVGVAYRSLFRSVPVNGGEGLGTSRTAMGRVTGVGVLPDGIGEGVLKRTGGADQYAVAINPRTAGDLMGVMKQGLRDGTFIPLNSDYDDDKQVDLISEGALPCSVAGLVLKVESYG